MKNLTFLYFLLSLSTRLFSQPMIENGVLTGWKNPPSKLIIPDEVTTIKSRSFKGITSITSVDFNNVKVIESGAFAGCRSLKHVSMPNVVRINARAMEGVVNLTNLNMPKCLVIGAFAFNGCTGLISVELPTIKKIDKFAFKSCKSLNTVDLSKAIDLQMVGGLNPEESPFDADNKNLTIYVSDESKIALFPSSDRRSRGTRASDSRVANR